MKNIQKIKKACKIAYIALKVICKGLAKYLWSHHKLFLTVTFTGLILIILGYTIAGGFLIGMYLIGVLFSPSYETIDDIIDDVIVYLCVIEKDDN
jgi:hypothetical protein